jgi:hypothetical protein
MLWAVLSSCLRIWVAPVTANQGRGREVMGVFLRWRLFANAERGGGISPQARERI